MPRYDYRCSKCDALFEITRPHSDRSPVACPSCSGAALRIFTPVGIVFKGSGFHNTDYRTPKESAGSGAPKPSCESGDSAACASCPKATD